VIITSDKSVGPDGFFWVGRLVWVVGITMKTVEDVQNTCTGVGYPRRPACVPHRETLRQAESAIRQRRTQGGGQPLEPSFGYGRSGVRAGPS
jgi:hypothetical protein